MPFITEQYSSPSHAGEVGGEMVPMGWYNMKKKLIKL